MPEMQFWKQSPRIFQIGIITGVANAAPCNPRCRRGLVGLRLLQARQCYLIIPPLVIKTIEMLAVLAMMGATIFGSMTTTENSSYYQ